MRRFTWRSLVLAVLPLLGLCVRPALAQKEQSSSSQKTTSDSLADAARKARERKKEAAKPKHVYTDDDMTRVQSAPVNVVGTAPASGAEASAASKGKVGAQPPEGPQAATKKAQPQESEEAKWRKRFREVRDNLARAEKQLDILQREDNKAQLQYYSDPQKALTEQYSRQEINDKNAKIAAKQQEIQQLKQQLSDLEDQLRKAGGDPGWAQ